MEGPEGMGPLLSSRTTRTTAGQAALSLLVFCLGLLMITPFIFMLSASFKHPGLVFVEPLRIIPRVVFLGNFQRVFADPLYPLWYWNSIRIVLITIPLRAFLVTLAAYAFARLTFAGKNIIFLLFMSTMMITPEATIVPRYLLYKAIRLIDNQWAIIVPAVFDVFFLFMLRAVFHDHPARAVRGGLPGRIRAFPHLPADHPAALPPGSHHHGVVSPSSGSGTTT